jgi:hypothetical protein
MSSEMRRFSVVLTQRPQQVTSEGGNVERVATGRSCPKKLLANNSRGCRGFTATEFHVVSKQCPMQVVVKCKAVSKRWAVVSERMQSPLGNFNKRATIVDVQSNDGKHDLVRAATPGAQRLAATLSPLLTVDAIYPMFPTLVIQ